MNPFRKAINWYFRRNALPYWCILFMDFFIVFVSGIITFWIFFHLFRLPFNFDRVANTSLIYAAISLIGIRVFRLYSGIIRYSSFVDLQKVVYANLLSMTIGICSCYLTVYLPRSVFFPFRMRHVVVLFLIATLFMWAIRVLVKVLYDIALADQRAKKALIYGAQTDGIGLAKNIRSQKPVRFILKGFITHDGRLRHSMILGEKVYGIEDDLKTIIENHEIEAILVSPLSTRDFQNNQALQDLLLEAGVKIYFAKNAQEWNNEKDGEQQDFSGVQIKEVSVEDLLPRAEIKVDMKSVGEQLSGHRILITGAAGSIGSEMVRQIAVYKPAAMMLIDQAETPEHDVRLMMSKEFPEIEAQTVVTSICKEDRMEKVFSEFRPDYVFHAAAYKHVPMMEDNPSEAVQNNIYGTKVIADLSVKYGVSKFVMVSTDKAVNPTNVMGCSKRICEIYVQSLDRELKYQQLQERRTHTESLQTEAKTTQFVTTRFGNVLGSNGSVIPLFREQIKNGGPVTVTHKDIIRYFMLIPEACKLVLEAGTKGNGGEIFVFDMGKPVRIADLAARMIKLSGAKDVKIEYTGLREGEKLYEEVLNEKENTKPTFHKKIRIAEVREYNFDVISKEIDELIAISKNYDDMATVKKMKEIVPEYKSNNSKYEQLDS